MRKAKMFKEISVSDHHGSLIVPSETSGDGLPSENNSTIDSSAPVKISAVSQLCRQGELYAFP